MAIGTVLAVAAIGGSIVSAGAQIYSGIQANKTAKDNADLQEQQADYQKDAYYDQALRLQDQGNKFLSSQKAAAGASGVRIDEGSPLAVMQESEANLAQDVARTKEMGDNAQTLGYSQADITKDQGQTALWGSVIGAGGSLLTNLASTGYNYGTYKGWQ